MKMINEVEMQVVELTQKLTELQTKFDRIVELQFEDGGRYGRLLRTVSFVDKMVFVYAYSVGGGYSVYTVTTSNPSHSTNQYWIRDCVNIDFDTLSNVSVKIMKMQMLRVADYAINTNQNRIIKNLVDLSQLLNNFILTNDQPK
jgi:hypothetical protein